MLDETTLIAEALRNYKERGSTLAFDPQEVVRMPKLVDVFDEHITEEKAQDDDIEFARPDDRVHLTIEEYLKRAPAEIREQWPENKEIQTIDWKPIKGKADDIDPGLREFILSPIPRFDRLIFNLGFWLYCEQSRRWYEETKDVEITELPAEEAYQHGRRELRRMTENSLYALDRYVFIREDTFPDGRKYHAGAPQAYLCFFIDRGNSFTLLKGRQAAITSTVMAVLCVYMLMRNNWTGVLLTDDKTKTGEDLFDKKVLSTLKLMPEWIKQEYTWDRQAKDNVTIDFREDNTKASRRLNFSDLMLLSSDDTQAVNSKTPSFTAFDEAQNIANATKIKGEVASTQDALIDGELRKTRQMAQWGTGTSNPVGKGVWLKDWRATYKAMLAGDYTGGWIPMFFDWTCRPGATLEWYMKKRAEAWQKFKYENDRAALAIFASACPSHPNDAFMETGSKPIPSIVIKKFRDRLLGLQDELRPIKGIFKPVYDMSRPSPEGEHSDHKYYIQGATFVPAKTSFEMLQAPVEMFLPPNNAYLDRNFIGTDPIQSASGRSKFSSAVTDKAGYHHLGISGEPHCPCGVSDEHFHPTVACLLNGRTHNVKEMYTQSALMAIHYRNHGQRACKHLIEYNQGQNFIEYLRFPWIDQQPSMLTPHQLPYKYRKGKSGNDYGIWMHNERKSIALLDLEELVYNHGHNIRFMSFWEQLDELELVEKSGMKTWGTRDDDEFNDDVVMSVLLSKICADSVDRAPRLFGGVRAPATRRKRIIDRRDGPFGTVLFEREIEYTPKYRQ